MATLSIFTLRDSKVNAYLQPFFMRSQGEAERAIKDILRDPNHNITRYAEDYSLFLHGSFDETTGIFATHEPKVICNAATLKD